MQREKPYSQTHKDLNKIAREEQKGKNNSMEIRSLNISDYDQIVVLWRLAELPYKPEGRDSKEAMQSQMKAYPDFFLGASRTTSS
jgi:hypothetical protein